ncbi:MAG: adenylate/guanylate cyclase domain-containing protein [Pseudomonadota bacterium]
MSTRVKRRVRSLTPSLLGLAVVISVLVLQALRPGLFETVADPLFDSFQRVEPRVFEPDGVVRVVDIDEASIRELGQWPWPRSFLAAMVDRLSGAGVAAVGFDMVFAEDDRTSPKHIGEVWQRYNRRFFTTGGGGSRAALELLQVEGLHDHDEIFGEAIARGPVVLGTFLSGGLGDGAVPVKAGVSMLGGVEAQRDLLDFSNAIVNLPQLSGPAVGVGSVSLAPAEVDVVRRVPMLSRVGEQVIPSLSLETLRVAQGAGSYILRASDAGGNTELGERARIDGMRVGALALPLEPDGTLRVRFAGASPIRRIPARDILEGAALNPNLVPELQGRIILVGASAAGLRDLVATPLEPSVPGVEVHAEIIEQIVAQEFLTRPDIVRGIERLAIVGLGGLVCALLFAQAQGIALMVATTSVAGSFVASWIAFASYATLLNPVGIAFATGGAYLLALISAYFSTEKSRREITKQFQHFVSPQVIEEIIADPDRHLSPYGDQRELSVMFLDVRSFSTITEKMPPEDVIRFINDLLTPLTDVILEHEGTVDKYMGDAIMAFWNAPRLTEDKETKAAQTALALLDALEDVNAGFAERGIAPVGISIGINTGLCSVGNMGSTRRLSYSCVGDPVNLASRLEGLTRRYGVDILIGSATASRAEGVALLRLDRVVVKGRTQPEWVWAVAGDGALAETPAFRALDETLDAARAAYGARDWDRAERLLDDLAAMAPVGRIAPAGIAAEFRRRIAEHRLAPPPEGWDGALVTWAMPALTAPSAERPSGSQTATAPAPSAPPEGAAAWR